jgi:4-amino-4-deoxy-L-arabinose transferase-like glycosyltransferase
MGRRWFSEQAGLVAAIGWLSGLQVQIHGRAAVADMPMVLFVATALCCTIGLACSSFIGNTARATVCAYLLTAAIFIVPALACQPEASKMLPPKVHSQGW